MSCNRELFEVALLIGTSKPPKGKTGPIMPSVATGVYIDNAQLVLFNVPSKVDPNDVCGFKSTLSQMAQGKVITFVAVASGSNHSALQRVQTADDTDEVLPAARVFIHRRDESVSNSLKSGIGVELSDVTVSMQAVRKGVYMVTLGGKSAKRMNF